MADGALSLDPVHVKSQRRHERAAKKLEERDVD